MNLESSPKGLRRLALYEEPDFGDTIHTPRMKGRYAEISMTQPEDIETLYQVRNTGTNPWRMDGFGKQVSIAQFEAKLFSPIVLNAFTVRRIKDNEIVGLTVLYRPALEYGWCFVEVMLRWKQRENEWKSWSIPNLTAMDAMGLTIDYAFDWYGLHMIRVEAVEFNASQWSGSIMDEVFDDQHVTKDVFKIAGQRLGLYEATIRKQKWSTTQFCHGALGEKTNQ